MKCIIQYLLGIIIYLVTGLSIAATAHGTHTLVINYDESFIWAYDESSVILYDGADVSHLSAYDFSSASIYGGEISFLNLFDSSTAEIHKANFSFLNVTESSTVNIYGSNFEYSNGRLSGFWSDGTHFSFWAGLMDNETGIPFVPTNILPAEIHLNEVPLPGAFFLLLTGLLTLLGFRHQLS